MKRNVLFLLVDQWPADAFGFSGSACSTPNIDRLASRGTVFGNAFTTCPLCTPARGALLTGRWPHETGVYDNCGVGYSDQPGLDHATPTWLDHAVADGYRVGYFGKWHLGTGGLAARGLHGCDQPGEVSVPYSENKRYTYDGTKAFYEDQAESLRRGLPPFWGETKGDADDTRCARVVASGLEFLGAHAAGKGRDPFFLTVSIADPHFPHYLPSEVVARRGVRDVAFPGNFGDGFENKPAFQKENWWPCHDTRRLTGDDWKQIFDYAMRHREYVDACLGRLLAALDTLGLADDTTVVFTSDHGDMCGAHNRFDKGPYYYDEVWRVPLIVAEPGKPAAQNAEFVSLIDLGRTLNRRFGSTAEPAGAVRIEDEVGVDKADPRHSTEAYGVYDAYNGHWFGIRAIRNQRFKYVRNYGDIDEFYDTVSDPHELTNAIDDPGLREQIEHLSGKLDGFLQQIGDPIATTHAFPAPGAVVHRVPYRR